MRKYPIGIQTFSEIRKGNYTYIDKTDLMWDMAHISKYVFLSRPRRFGKSLLSTTLKSYFNGEKALFEGLKIMDLEKEWKKYPVIYLDLSGAKDKGSTQDLCRYLDLMLSEIETYQENGKEHTPGEKLTGIIRRLYEKNNSQVVVIIDEYDAPLLDVLHEGAHLDEMRKVMREFYQPLKMMESMVKFCFITGITKFSQLSVFSTLNNINNVSMLPQFSAICGITDTELHSSLAEDVHLLAEKEGCTDNDMFVKLKQQYDGYHFAKVSEDIYNPYSLMNAFNNGDVANYWFTSGTPTYLIHQLRIHHTNITELNNIKARTTAFDVPTETMQDAIPLLYQSGYLTIVDYDKGVDNYTLAIPNREVRVGLTECLLPAYVGLNQNAVHQGFAIKFYRAMKEGNIEHALRETQAFLAGIPYVEGFKKKLKNASTTEGFYEYTFYLIFSMLDAYVSTQVKCHGGRIDMIVLMPDTTYIFEFKINQSAQKASAQIFDRHYADAYRTDGRNVVTVGVLFDTEEWTIKEWNIVN